MNIPLQKGALRAAERFIEAERRVREASYLPNPTESAAADLRECIDTMATVQRAIVDLELGTTPLAARPAIIRWRLDVEDGGCEWRTITTGTDEAVAYLQKIGCNAMLSCACGSYEYGGCEVCATPVAAPVAPKFTPEEACTILAALRHWQLVADPKGQSPDHFENVEPLSDEDIDDLCERINIDWSE